jgi:hypothetical protein
MRELSAKIGIDETTFEPVMILMLDGEETGTILEVEAISDLRVLHGESTTRFLIEMVVDSINDTHNLTPDEINHYTTNFKSLVAI